MVTDGAHTGAATSARVVGGQGLSVKGDCSVQSLSRVQFLWPHEPQHSRPPCPSPTPRVYLNSCPSSRWCHPTISSSVVPFSSSPQPFPASGSFQMSPLFTSGSQSIGVSASTSVLCWPRTPNCGSLHCSIDLLILFRLQSNVLGHLMN